MENEILLNLIGNAGGATKSVDEAVSALRNLGGQGKNTKKKIDQLTSSVKKTGDTAAKTATAFQKLTKSLGRIAFYRAIRTALKDITSGIREGIGNLYQYSVAFNQIDDKASNAMVTMNGFATASLWVKNSVGAMLMPVLQSLLPVVESVAEVFIWATNVVNQFIEALQGSRQWTKALRYPKDYADAVSGVGKAAKEAKKQLFGFDELNIFNAPTDNGSGAANALDFSSMFTEVDVSDGFAKVTEVIRTNLAIIEEIVGSAALAVGAILLASGHIGLGIGAIVAGATLKWKARGLNSNALGKTIEEKLGSLVALSAPVLLGIGTILLLSGHIGWGIGAIVGGITALGVSGGFGWTDNLRNDIQTKLDTLVTLTGLTMLALGTVLAFTDPTKLPIAIGLIAAGVATIATNATVNWDWLGSTISARLAAVTAVVSAASLALGAILVFTNPTSTLGYGLLAAGALGLATSSALDWDNVPNKVRAVIGVITTIASGASLALGAILFFSSGSPIGMALMLAGAVGLATTVQTFAPGKWAAEKFAEIDTKADEFITGFLSKALTAGKDFVDNLKQGISDKWNSFKSWLSGKSLNINARVNADYSFGSLPGRAEGGFVDSGQIFMARENGIPEMVGSFGNQTAVANNSQIVEGISAGVESAMDNTNSVILQMANAIVNAIAEKQINTTVISDRDIYRSAERGRTLSGSTVFNGI